MGLVVLVGFGWWPSVSPGDQGVSAIEASQSVAVAGSDAMLRPVAQRSSGGIGTGARSSVAGDSPGGEGAVDRQAASTDGPVEQPSAITEGEGRGSQAATQRERDSSPVLIEYRVQPGDTVSQIAERFGIGTEYILWNNIDILSDADVLPADVTLQIPGVEGIIHSARVGDTASDLAVHYDSTTEAIVGYAANGFGGDPDLLPVGALILIPGGRMPPPPPSAEAAPGGPGTEATPPPAPSWTWPATGRLTSAFSPRHPLGIDISMVVKTPIVAAMSGTVTFVGGNPCCSYGYHVIIDHGDGHETLYAHLSAAHVSAGQWVEAGEVIAASGNTGYSTGPHLHFEVRKGGVHHNPLLYLP